MQTPLLEDSESPALPSTADAVAEITKDMANSARMRRVGRMCLLAALMRLSDEIEEISDVHAPAIANAPAGVAAEMRQLRRAAFDAIAALKREG